MKFPLMARIKQNFDTTTIVRAESWQGKVGVKEIK
jgi:hypothetical protein